MIGKKKWKIYNKADGEVQNQCITLQEIRWKGEGIDRQNEYISLMSYKMQKRKRILEDQDIKDIKDTEMAKQRTKITTHR